MTTATESLLGESNAFLEIIEQASRLAPLRKPVLIIGERGTGAGAFVRASFGTFHDPSLVEAEDRTLIGYALEDLAAVTGFTARPVETFVQRWWGGLPVYGVGHPAKMDAVRRAVDAAPGVAVAGAYLDGVGVPACVEAGRAAAEKIVAELV